MRPGRWHERMLTPVLALVVAPLAALGLVVVAANWYWFVATQVTGKHHSVVPPLGAVVLCLCCLVFPATRPYAWVPFLIDPAGPLLAIALVWMAWHTLRGTDGDSGGPFRRTPPS